tara:strand:+ start:714 stop:1337 length:624 start_codon:yes stop_codon:yes gene_type:complete
MRLLLTVALSFISLSSCASSELTGNLTEDVNVGLNSIIAQKALESGVSFLSNANEYQLISGGRAAKPSEDASVMSANRSLEQSQLLWEGKNGEFVLSISNQNQNMTQQNAQVLSSSSQYNQIAYNPRTGGIAVITGQIIVSYTAEYDAKFIGANFGIQLVQDFPHLNIAFYTVNMWQDIFITTNSLNQSGLVSSAEVEVMENFAMPN